MHYYQWVYQVDVPISNQLIKIIKMEKNDIFTAFFGGAFICGGSGGTKII